MAFRTLGSSAPSIRPCVCSNLAGPHFHLTSSLGICTQLGRCTAARPNRHGDISTHSGSGLRWALNTKTGSPSALLHSTVMASSSLSGAMTEDVLNQEDIWPATCTVYDKAQESGAATTTQTTVDVHTERCGDADIAWVLRLATFLKKKPTPTQPAEESSKPAEKKPFFNPFDPPEPALTVGHLSATHTLVLNKFNVVPHHSIVVTRGFQPQTDPLNSSDLEAVYRVLRAMPNGSLGFFNCGEHSGRSQPHKHVQIVPLPFAEGYPPTPPLASAFLRDAPPELYGEPCEARNLPFRAYCCRIGPESTPEELEAAFSALFSAASAADDRSEDGTVSYNWLGCQDFMALFPRSKEKTQGLAVNALGFAGTMLCRSEEEVAAAKRHGCLNILADVGQPW